MRKKYIGVILLMALVCASLAGCAFNKKNQTPSAAESSQVTNEEPSKEQVHENAKEAEANNSPNEVGPESKPGKVNEKKFLIMISLI